MTMREKLNLIRSTTLEGVQEAHVKALSMGTRASEISNRAKVTATLGFTTLSYFVFAPLAAAGTGCDSSAATKLTGFISNAAAFMMALGGAAALLMFAVGGFFIIVGGSESRVRRGMGMLKNAVIGLVVLAAGIFIKVVVLSFVGGATGGSDKGPKCINTGGTSGLQ